MPFTPRTTPPSASDLRWIRDLSGGYNQCIYGSNGPPSVLPNCTGYVHGRVMEIRGVNTDDSGLSFGNADQYYNGSSPAWIQQNDPSLGAIVCYTGGDYNTGHVAVVEQIIDANTIVISESNYGGISFQTLTCYRSYGWRPTPGWNIYPQGFLKNPYVDGGGGGGGLTPSMLLLLLSKKRKEDANGVRITGII